jgi:hypothetical protein
MSTGKIYMLLNPAFFPLHQMIELSNNMQQLLRGVPQVGISEAGIDDAVQKLIARG